MSETGPTLVHLRSASAADTARLGGALARLLAPGDVVLLSGTLGAGKTTLVKAVVAALGGGQEVTSPTFTLLHTYATDPPVVHVDCWRLEQLHEVLDLGLEELLDEGAVALVEWGEAAAVRFGEGALAVTLSLPSAPSPPAGGEPTEPGAEGSTTREVELVGDGAWAARLRRLEAEVGAS